MGGKAEKRLKAARRKLAVVQALESMEQSVRSERASVERTLWAFRNRLQFGQGQVPDGVLDELERLGGKLMRLDWRGEMLRYARFKLTPDGDLERYRECLEAEIAKIERCS